MAMSQRTQRRDTGRETQGRDGASAPASPCVTDLLGAGLGANFSISNKEEKKSEKETRRGEKRRGKKPRLKEGETESERSAARRLCSASFASAQNSPLFFSKWLRASESCWKEKNHSRPICRRVTVQPRTGVNTLPT